MRVLRERGARRRGPHRETLPPLGSERAEERPGSLPPRAPPTSHYKAGTTQLRDLCVLYRREHGCKTHVAAYSQTKERKKDQNLCRIVQNRARAQTSRPRDQNLQATFCKFLVNLRWLNWLSFLLSGCASWILCATRCLSANPPSICPRSGLTSRRLSRPETADTFRSLSPGPRLMSPS